MIELREYIDEIDYLETNKNDLLVCNAIMYSKLQKENIYVPLWSSNGDFAIQKYFKNHIKNNQSYDFPFSFVSTMFNYNKTVKLRINILLNINNLRTLYSEYYPFVGEINSDSFNVSIPMIHPIYLNDLLCNYEKIIFRGRQND